MSSEAIHHPLVTTTKHNLRRSTKSRHISYSNSPSSIVYKSPISRILPTRLSLCIFLVVLLASVQSSMADAELSETLNVLEEQDIGQEVARVGNHAQAPPPFMATLWSPSSGVSIFTVDQRGVFKLAKRLDREAGIVSFSVVLQSMKTFAGLKVTLNVVDVNDWAPKFSPHAHNVTLRIQEATPTDTRLIIGSVSDRDLSHTPNSDLRCELVNSDPVFRLVATSLSRGTSDLSLYLQLVKKLDYETRIKYDMQLTCSDSGEKTNFQVYIYIYVQVFYNLCFN